MSVKFCGRFRLVLNRDEWLLRLMKDPTVMRIMIEEREKSLKENLPKDFKEELMEMLSES